MFVMTAVLLLALRGTAAAVPTSPSLINLFPRGDQNIDCYFQPELLAVPNSSVLVAVAEARMFSCNDGPGTPGAVKRP